MKAYRIALGAAVALALSASIQAQVLYTYTFTGTGSLDGATVPGGTLAPIMLVGGLSNQNGPNALLVGNFTTAATIDLGSYISLAITADPGYVITLDSLDGLRRRFNNGPQNGRVALFLNGSPTPVDFQNFPYTNTVTGGAFNFADIVATDNVTTAEFRLYGWNSTTGGPATRLAGFDDVSITGTFTAVPEPGSVFAGLAALGSVAYGWRRRRA